MMADSGAPRARRVGALGLGLCVIAGVADAQATPDPHAAPESESGTAPETAAPPEAAPETGPAPETGATPETESGATPGPETGATPGPETGTEAAAEGDASGGGPSPSTPRAADSLHAAPADAPPVRPDPAPPQVARGDAVTSPQDAPAPAPPDEVEEILVTGSRIKRTSFAAASPVDVISRRELEYSGATNLSDVVQHLTVAQGSGWDGSVASPTTTSVNLRGLGVGTTLVLLNGRRIAASGGGADVTFVDIGTIPLAAVDRIEILKGGASAIYGSDAVAGVINIITRTDWDGIRAEADAAITDNLDREELNASLSLGAASERARLSVAFGYSRSGELIASDRPWTDREDRISNPGYPGTFLLRFPPQTIPDPDCAEAPYSRVAEGLCEFDDRRFLALIGNAERGLVYGHAEYDVADHAHIFVELGASRTRGDGIFAPSLPFPPPFPIVPGDHVDNPFGRQLEFIGSPVGAEAGGQRNTGDDDSLRTAFGLRGDLGGVAANTFAEDWEWEVFTTVGASRYRGILHDTISEAFQDALDSCNDPRDLSGCYNPFYSSQLGTGTPNHDAVIASFSGVLVSQTDHSLRTHNAGITGSLFELPGGSAGFALGGELRHEWRTTDFDHDANAGRLAFFEGNTDAAAKRDVYGAYLELLWPLANGVELQTAGRLEKYTDTDALAASPTLGVTLQPAEIVGRERVVPALRLLQLRGQVTRSFRAPTIYQSFPGFAMVPGLYDLPSTPLPVFAPVQTFGNPELDPERALVVSAGLEWAPANWLALTLDYWQYDYQDRISLENAEQILRAELAARGTDDYVPDPRVVPGTDCMGVIGPCIDRIVVRNLNQGDVFTNGIDFGVLFSLDGSTFGGREDDFGTLTFGGEGTYTLAYEIPRAAQTILEDSEGNPVLDDEGEPVYPGGCDGEVCDVTGLRNVGNFAPPLPQLRFSLPITYSLGGHATSAFVRYIGSFEDDAFGVDAEGTFAEVDAVVTLDLQYGYTLSDVVGRALTVRVGVRNVMDTDPPTVRPSGTLLTGFVGAIHDPRGRMVYAQLIQEL